MNTTDKVMAHVQHACATFKPSSLRIHDDVMASLRAEIEALARDAERWRKFLATRPAGTHAVINEAIDATQEKQS